ncbi:MAG: hypothetical protein IJG62_07995 [Synergistaceae bacterium]|nr:hypothetical protein [Synergistaceae bacterium]MBQ9896691.1 hypothetical protein [Synergistaceae bacterium]MBR0220795.1 hypothetical protein [Synergistaceae bacterium]
MTVENLIEIASGLDEYNLEKLCDYAAFLKYMAKREDEEDAAAVIARANEPEISFEDLKAELINI